MANESVIVEKIKNVMIKESVSFVEKMAKSDTCGI